ncbi:MAG: pyruvate kinase [Bdellovibrionales bacterium]|jgi:pyruvate kinase|nr:pyruvate kinase [Bdellovibrionales bacterium]
MRRAKIVATLGPSSNTVEKITELITAGMDVARINMGHGNHESHKKLINNIRTASKNAGKQIAVLIDLQGPKIRIGNLKESLILESGSEWYIGASKLQKKYPQYANNFIPTVYENLVNDCQDGCQILFDDGKIIGRAISKENNLYKIKIEIGGELKSKKGINLPDVEVTATSFTAQDEDDLMFGLEAGIDYIALSFVRKKDDVQKIKLLLHKLKVRMPIISKVENAQGLENIEEIIDVSDGVMVARGDMGVELGNHLVPSAQKTIINLCNKKRIPVITATQMLESMIENSTPTRAEASDVANAVWDGTDAVMLSGESASGKYPVQTIEMMSKIVVEAEKTPKERAPLKSLDLSSITAANMLAATLISEKVYAKAIVSVTQFGNSCSKIAGARPLVPVLGITSSMTTLRKMSLYWGVIPFFSRSGNKFDDTSEKKLLKDIRNKLKLSNGDKLVITKGDGKMFSEGTSNLIRVEVINDAPKVAGGKEFLETAEFDLGQINLDTHACTSCQECLRICPVDIWAVSDDSQKRVYIKQENAEKCLLDMECVDICPTGAIEIINKIF